MEHTKIINNTLHVGAYYFTGNQFLPVKEELCKSFRFATKEGLRTFHFSTYGEVYLRYDICETMQMKNGDTVVAFCAKIVGTDTLGRTIFQEETYQFEFAIELYGGSIAQKSKVVMTRPLM